MRAATNPDDLLRLLDAFPPVIPSRILVFGPFAIPISEALRARGHVVVAGVIQAREPALADGTRPPPGSFDVIVAAGLLEDLSWDRWALQQMHRWLSPDGRLLVTAPNLWSPLALADPRYVAGKLAKQWPKVLRRLGRTPAPARDPARPVRRAYDVRRLRGMLEQLGFAVERASLGGLGSEHILWARRQPGVFGLAPERPFPDPVAHHARFDREHRDLGRIRDAWLAAQPGPAAGVPAQAPRELVPGEYAGAEVLVLAPHPDDEIIGCGGTIGLLARAGARVTVVQATDGSASAAFVDEPEAVRRQVRLDEATAVARAAGIARTIFWREDNQAFVYRPELVTRLRGILEEVDPALIFVPFITDIHADHVLLARILAEALEGWDRPHTRVLGYEIWSRVPANAWCDVTAIMPELLEWILLYETAMKVDDFVHACAARDYANALTLSGRAGFVEAFHAGGVAAFRDLVNRAAGSATIGSLRSSTS